MNPKFRRALGRTLAGWSVGVVLACVLAACGGGGGGDLAGVGTGGTGTVSSTVGVGPISGFGSVIISGVRYDDSAATVTDEDGNARTRADLKLGMVGAVSGSADFVAGTGVATGIRYGSGSSVRWSRSILPGGASRCSAPPSASRRPPCSTTV